MSEYVFSLGYRCSAAGILKRLGIKTESYPFDWLVSRLPIVEHCIETDFKEFLDPANYEYLHTNTYHYPTPTSNPEWICGEDIYWNKYYQDPELFPQESLVQYYLQLPLQRPRDAYAHNLLMNHRNINKSEDHAYLIRCVERWRQMSESSVPKQSLYIHPIIMREDYDEGLIDELYRFHNKLASHLPNYRGNYVIPVRESECSKTDEKTTPLIVTMIDQENCKIVLLMANYRMIDAGEIFMGDMWPETNLLCDWVKSSLQ